MTEKLKYKRKVGCRKSLICALKLSNDASDKKIREELTKRGIRIPRLLKV